MNAQTPAVREPVEMTLSGEERIFIGMYRELSRWEKNAAYLLLQSIAWGSLNHETTDHKSWPAVKRMVGLPEVLQ